MSFKVKVVGSGITKKQVGIITSSSSKKDVERHLKWRDENGLLEIFGFDVDNLAEEVWAREILSKAGLPTDPTELVKHNDGTECSLMEFVQDGTYDKKE